MKNTRWFVLAVSLLVALLMPAMAMAQSPFDGGEIPGEAGRLFAAKRDVSLQNVRSGGGREGGWAGPEIERVSVL